MAKVQLFLIIFLVTVITAKENFKLFGSQHNWEGNVMVHDGGDSYFHLCDTGWNLNTANVICRELGFPGALFLYYGLHFPYKEATSDARQWVCKGHETNINQCNVTFTKDLFDCNERFAGVQCSNPASRLDPSADCNFDKDMCDYESNLTYGDLLWQRTIGEIEGKPPSKDQGHYMYLTTGRLGSGAKGQLKSPSTIFGKTCLTFSYFMGTIRGTLRVYVFTLHSYPKKVWSLEFVSDQKPKWKKAKVLLPSKDSTLPSHVIFEGEVGIGAINHIAVDDIKINNVIKDCETLPDKAKPPALESSKSDLCKQKTVKGKCCSFPFMKDGINYTSCAKLDSKSEPWCAIGENRNVTGRKNITSKGEVWDECNNCTEKTIHGNCCFYACKEDLDRRWCYTDMERQINKSCREIRLEGPPTSTSGRVQVYHKGRWGTVCAVPNWGIHEAQVVCRELGFENATHELIPKNNIKEVENRAVVWLQEVDCTGNEPKLSLCLHRGWGISNCPPDKLAGVVCKEPTPTSRPTPPPTIKAVVTNATEKTTVGTIGTTSVTTDNSLEVRFEECNKEDFKNEVEENITDILYRYCKKPEHNCKAEKEEKEKKSYSVYINGKPPTVRISVADVSRDTLEKSISDVDKLGGCKIIKQWNWIRMLEYGGVALLAVLGIILYCLKRGKKGDDGSKTVYTKVPSVSEDSADEHNGNSRKSEAEKGLLRQKEKKLNKLASKNC